MKKYKEFSILLCVFVFITLLLPYYVFDDYKTVGALFGRGGLSSKLVLEGVEKHGIELLPAVVVLIVLILISILNNKVLKSSWVMIILILSSLLVTFYSLIIVPFCVMFDWGPDKNHELVYGFYLMQILVIAHLILSIVHFIIIKRIKYNTPPQDV